MNIQKFTQKSVEAINNCEKLAYDYGNQEIEQEHLLVCLLYTSGYLKKMASEADGRVTYIAVTRKGTNLSQKYDEQYFKSLLPYMEEIDVYKRQPWLYAFLRSSYLSLRNSLRMFVILFFVKEVRCMLSGKADPGDAPTVARRCSSVSYTHLSRTRFNTPWPIYTIIRV